MAVEESTPELPEGADNTTEDTQQVQAPGDRIDALYTSLTAAKYNLGTPEKFRESMADPKTVAGLFTSLTAAHYNLGDKDEFVKNISQDYSTRSMKGVQMYDKGSIGNSLDPSRNNFISNADKSVNLAEQAKNYKPTLASENKTLFGKTRSTDGNARSVDKVDPLAGDKDPGTNMLTQSVDFMKSLSKLVPETVSSALRVGSRALAYSNPSTMQSQLSQDLGGVKNPADAGADKIDDFSEKNLTNNTSGSHWGEVAQLPVLIGLSIVTGGANAPVLARALGPALMAGSMQTGFYHEALNAGAGNGGALAYSTIGASAGMLINGAAIAGISKITSKLATKFVAQKVITELASKEFGTVTAESFGKAVARNSNLAIKMLQGPAKFEFGKTLALEFGAGVLSHEFNEGAKAVYNKADKDVKFHLEDAYENAKGALQTGLMFAATGSLGAVGKFIHDVHGNDEAGDHITNAIANDPASADVMRKHSDDLLYNNNLAPEHRESPFVLNFEQHQEVNKKIDTAEKINSSIPETVKDPAVRAKVIGGISQRNEVDNALEALKEQKKGMDESMTDKIDEKIKNLEEHRENINNTIKLIVGGEDANMPVMKSGKSETEEETAKKESEKEKETTEPVKEEEKVAGETDSTTHLTVDGAEANHLEVEEEKQKTQNNSSSDDSPKEYKGISAVREKIREAVNKYKEAAKDKFNNYKDEAVARERAYKLAARERYNKYKGEAEAREREFKTKARGKYKDFKAASEANEKAYKEKARAKEKEYRQKATDAEVAYKKAATEKDQASRKAKSDFLDFVKDFVGKLGPKAPAHVKSLIPEIIKLTSGITNEASLEKALDNVNGIIDKIHLKEQEAQAGTAAKKLSKLIQTFKGVDPRLTEVLQRLSNLGKKPDLLSSPDEYAAFVANVLGKNGNLGVSTNEIEQYVAKQQAHGVQVLKDRAAQLIETQLKTIQGKLNTMEKKNPGSTKGITAKELFDDNSLHNSFFGEKGKDAKEGSEEESEEEIEKKKTVREIITDMIKDAQSKLPSEEGLSPRQKAALIAMRDIDPNGEHLSLNNDDLKLLNFAIHNILANGPDAILKGTDPFIQFYLSNEIHNAMSGLAIEHAKTFFNWSKRFALFRSQGVAIRKIDVNGEEGSVKAKTPMWGLRLRRDKVTFRQGIKALNPSPAYVLKVYHAYFEPFERGYTKAKIQTGAYNRGLLDANEHNGITREDAARIRIYSILRQINRSSPHSEIDQFNAYKSVIRDSMLKMHDHFDGEENGQFQRQAELISILKKSGLYELFVDHSDSIQKHPENGGDSLEYTLGIEDRHLNVIEYMDAAHDKMKPDIMGMYEKLGIEPSDVHQYTHMDYLDLPYPTPDGMSTDQKLSDSNNNFFGKSDIKNIGPHVTKRVDLPIAPENSYINLDHSSSFVNGTNRQLMTTHTISERMLTSNVMDDARTNMVFDATMDHAKKNDTNARFFKNLILENIGDSMGMNRNNSKVSWLDAENVGTILLNNIKKKYFVSTLGSVFQYVKQYAESGSAAAVLVGDPRAFHAGLKLANTKSESWNLLKGKLMEAGSPLMRRMVEGEDLHVKEISDSYTRESTGYTDIGRGISGKMDKFGEYLMSPLKKGDMAVSIHTWNATYLRELKKSGIIKNYSDFDANFIKSHTLDKKAMTVADDMVERTNAKVEGTLRARFIKNTDRGSLSSLFTNMKTFQLHANVEARIALRNVISGADTKQGIRQVVSYAASQVASGLVKTLAVNPIRKAAVAGALYYILGKERYDKYNQQRLEQQQKGGRLKDQKELNWVQKDLGFGINDGRQIANLALRTASDVFAGSQDNITQGAEEFGADFLYKKLWLQNLQGSEQIAGARKSLFYSDENFFGYGSYQAVVNGVIHPLFGDGGAHPSIFDQASAMPNAEDKVKLGAAQFVASMTQLYGGADAGAVAQQVNSGIQRYMQNNEFKLSKYYDDIRTIVAKTGLKVEPFNLKMVNYLDIHDEQGKEVNFTPEMINSIDRNYAKELKENLEKNDILGESMEDARMDVERAKKDALKEAIDNHIPEGWTTVKMMEKDENKGAEQYEQNLGVTLNGEQITPN